MPLMIGRGEMKKCSNLYSEKKGIALFYNKIFTVFDKQSKICTVCAWMLSYLVIDMDMHLWYIVQHSHLYIKKLAKE